MKKREFEKARQIPIDKARVMRQFSLTTIRYLIDAIVELITNSDDSYKLLEQENVVVKGKIIVEIHRLKYGKCEEVKVIDFARGMDKNKLEQALTFAGATSGFEAGRSVRGLLGRGLKETIIALGKAEIYTIKEDKLCISNVWWDEKVGLMFEILENPYSPSKGEREEIGIIEGNGTVVMITGINEKIKCPDYKTFHSQITNHYALRDINSATNNNREVILRFESPEKAGLKIEKHISYEMPKGKKILEKSIKIPGYGDVVKIKIYESEKELESPYNNPYARAGLLVKASGAILDSQFFKYQSERAGCFFFGEVIWEGLAGRLRKEDWGVINPDRTGINWHHQYCEVLRGEIEKILMPLIENKKKQIEVKPSAPPSEKIEKLNKDICSLLNKLAKENFTEPPPDIDPDEKIEELTIKPQYANIEIDKERCFSVYAPLDILNPTARYYRVETKSNNPIYIQVLDPNVKLHPHRKYPDLYYYGNFRVIGRIVNQEATITCKLNEHIATTVVRVAKLKKGKKKKKLTGAKGGFFHDIKSKSEPNPTQRVRYDEANRIIFVYTKFPGVKKYFEDNLNLKIAESKPMYAELIGEAFCEFAARYSVEHGTLPIMSDPIDAYTIAMDNSQRKYLHLIHEAVFKHRL